MSKSFVDNDNAQSIFQGYANRIKGQQGKNLSKTITFKGTQYTTVEGILCALKEAVDPSPTVLTLGETYTFGNNGDTDIEWICAESGDGYYVLQSFIEITTGYWPGYKMTGPSSGTGDWGNADTKYTDNIDGADIYTYDTKTETLYNSIKDAEKTDVSYGKGLFLVSNAKAGTTIAGAQGSGYYWQGLKNTEYANWLGTIIGNGNTNTWFVYTDGQLNNATSQSNSRVGIAPAFNLDPSKVTVDANNVITLK